MYKGFQLVKAWESTVRRSQHHHHHQPSNQQPPQQQPLSRRGRGCIFGSMSIVPASDADFGSSSPLSNSSSASASADDESELYHAERLLPNGDFYTGYWSSGLPHGVGKYLWTDGCMYEGEWRHGKTMGRGSFSWPSGATYEGDFKAGFMDGTGTYIGASGDTYKGGWAMNLKHGTGKKSYCNGDYYDGEWRSGMQDGHGRYIWNNGNEYVGQWRSGVIHGRGSLIWSNGNRYDGGWEEGVPMGNGSFRWGDGSLYIGIWSREGEEQQKGIYYPSPSATSPTARDPQEIFASELPECKICPGEVVSILPSQKTLNWLGMEADFYQKQAAAARSNRSSDAPRPRRRSSVDSSAALMRRPNARTNTIIGINSNSNGGNERGFERICIWESDGDITCDIVDGNSVMSGGRASTDEMMGSLRSEELESRVPRSQQPPGRWTPRAMKKQGGAICKGHKNYELMLNLQLGIRYISFSCKFCHLHEFLMNI